MKKIFLIISILLVSSFVLAACGTATAEPTSEPVSLQQTGGGDAVEVIVEGRIVPRDYAMLYFSAPGTVAEVMVTEGEFVTKGTILAKLGDRENYEASLVAAQAEVLAAEQALDALNRTASLAYNQAVLDEAKAEKAYYDALIAWDSFDESQYEDDLDQAKADVSTAKKELEDARDEFSKYSGLDKNNADRRRTKQDLDAAQKKYDGALAAQAELENRYANLQAGLEAAKAAFTEATRTRENRTDGPDKDQLAVAQARLDAANARLAAAQAALDSLDIVAPYDGVVARIDVSSGEKVSPTQLAFVFADFSQWYVETTDLTEDDIVKITAGQSVVVIPDVMPDTELSGSIERIGQTYTEKSGDVVYTVRIRLDDSNDKLRWGMTVEVRFLPK